MRSMVIKEGMWKDCLEYAVKVKAHCLLLEAAKDDHSTHNQQEMNRYATLFMDEMNKLTKKYQLDIDIFSKFIINLVGILQVVPIKKLEECNPVGLEYKILPI